MHTEVIELVTFPSGAAWKVYRDGELVAIYSDRSAAENAVVGFADEITKTGNGVNIKVLMTREEAVAHGACPD